MRTTLLTIFLNLLFTLSANAGGEEVIYNPRGTPISQRILGYKSYEDIRIDADLDGKTDEWYLKKGNLEVRISYQNGIKRSIAISNIVNNIFSYKKFERINQKFVQTASFRRQTIIMYGMPPEDTPCSATDLLNAKVSQLSQDITAMVSSPQSCDLKNFPQFTENMSRALHKAPRDGKIIADCVQNAKNIKDIDLNLVASKLRISYQKISTGQSNNVFSCQPNAEGKFRGQTEENGSVTFMIPKSSQDPVVDVTVLRPLLHHELLHAAGIKNEDRAAAIVKSCLEKGTFSGDLPSHDPGFVAENPRSVMDNIAVNSAATITSTENIATGISAATKSPGRGRAPASSSNKAKASIDSAAAKSGSGIDMKSEIANAEAIIPSAEKLNVAKVDKSPAGKEQALRDSVQESAPVFRMANQAMGMSSNPALADSSGSGSSETGSSSSRTSKSTYQARYGRYQSKHGDGVGSDEYIAEEIDLTKGTEAQAKNAAKRPRPQQASQTGTYQPATLATDSQESPTRGPASLDTETGAGRKTRGGVANNSDFGGSIATGSAGGPANLGSGGGSGGGTGTTIAPKSRTPASVSRAPASTNQAGSPAQLQKIKTELVNDDYVLTKRRLRDDGGFISELEANNVTITDTMGGRWGAKKGTTIFLDDGNRFIRQR